MQDDALYIKGLAHKRALEGKLSVNGAKNAVLKILAAAFLFEGELLVENVPELLDVKWMLEILSGMGIDSEYDVENSTIRLSVSKDLSCELDFDVARKLRSSVVLSGPVLARLGKVSFPFPGGDKIGLRPVDLFLESFEKMGALAQEENEQIKISAKDGLKGAEIFFRKQSVTATESAMMAATLAEGEVVLKNAAMEPEIVHLAKFLNEAGADIVGAGTSTITIKGNSGRPLQAKHSYTVPPDRIEAGSFMALAAVVGKDIYIENCLPQEMEAVLEYYSYIGLNFEIGKSHVRIKDNPDSSELQMRDFATHEYPGFPTDMQAPTVAAMTQISGEAFVFESIFADRFGYVDSLRLMGADIVQLDTRNILVKGPRLLHGRTLRSIDIRAGLAYIIAAASAEGDSKIENVFHIDRGYADIEQRLETIGLDIKRV